MDKINYILPNFMEYGRNEILIKLFYKKPNLFIENSQIYSFYGSFPNAIFNGGRPCFANENVSIREIKKIKSFYNKNNIRITLTFTNQCLEEKHLSDKYCNQILKVFHDGYNEVLVASSLLENYIRENYPKFKINKSITATIKDGNEDYANYNLLVIDKKNNKNFEYLRTIKEKNRIEILCDEVCVNDCKYTNQHYKEISMAQLGKVEKKSKNFGLCRYPNKVINYSAIRNRNLLSKYYISKKEIDKYFELGFKYFKLSGREKQNLIGTYSIIEYCFLDKYQYDITTFIYERFILETESDFNG